jgi:sulfur-oxidizing protein SoxZ
VGDIIKVRVLVTHPMEIVQRKDGKPVDKNYHFINRVIVSYLEREIAQFEITQSVSENPFFAFAVRATEPGPLRVTFVDTHGGKYEGTAEIKFS